MKLEFLSESLSVCKLASLCSIPSDGFFCLTKTEQELSLVCPTSSVPSDTLAREDGWCAFRVAGTLDFSLIGILANLSRILAEAKISLFAVSTYDTDYILIKETDKPGAIHVLTENGYSL